MGKITDSPERIVAVNLRRLMAYAKQHDEPGSSGVSLEAASGVSNSSISRYVNEQTSIAVDHLHLLAQVYGLHGWQLLFPELDPANPPVVPVTATERELYKLLEAGAELLARQGGLHGVAVEPDEGPDTGHSADRPVSGKKSSRGAYPRRKVHKPT